MASRIDKFGTPEAYNHYAVGWAHAMDTPYQWTKQVASHWGGTRNGTIVHWPNGIAAKGEIRTQFHHVIDVAPTVLEAAGLPEPTFVNGVQQMPLHGVSAWPTRSTTPTAAERHETQYFEMFVQPRHLPQGLDRGHPAQHAVGDRRRAAAARRRRVGALRARTTGPRRTTSPSEQPEKLHELQRLFLIEATQVQRAAARRPPRRALQPRPRRPAAARSSGNSQLLFGGMGRLTRELGRRASRTSRTR